MERSATAEQGFVGRFASQMASITRSSILSTLIVVIVLATLPSAIRRVVQTGDLYLFTRQFFEDLFARLSGAPQIYLPTNRGDSAGFA
jgi:cystathionine beta-lyase/cystathionine gamma-synthase